MAETDHPRLYIPDRHIWIREESDGSVLVGFSSYGLITLGTLESVKLPECDAEIPAEEPFAVVEATKAAFELALPFSARIVRVNLAVLRDVDVFGSDPEGAGWLACVTPASPSWREGLLDEESYRAFVAP